MRLPNDLVAAVDEWARANGYGDRSSAIRAMIRCALGRERVRSFGLDEGSKWDEPIADVIKSYGIECGSESD
jgi:Arc/MetJ-type ribon-helix-helix transcriptional regulator